MSTGLASANFQNKSLVGFQDLGLRMLAYLKASHEDANQARFDLDGAVSVLIPGTPTIADSIEFGTGKATDGIGHIFDFTQLSVTERTLLFANQVGIIYYMAAAYAQEVRGIRVSPETGAPQYVELLDTIGEEGAPNSVIDNGNGTITLTINSITEASVDHTGKKVVVWLVTPQSASESVAIEVVDCVFGGGNNTITTAGGLGQTTISTNPADYVVLARGVSFRTNPFPAGFFNLGTVLGNGPAAVPNALDTTTQRLLKTFQDASQITFTPYLYIASVNVQSAIEELINDLQEHTTATAGGIRIGINPNDFSDKATQANHQLASVVGGVGTISDGTFSSTGERHVDRTLAEVDRVLRNRQTHLTYGSLPDSDDTTLAPSFGTRMYHLRPQAISGYEVGTTDVDGRVVGEQGDLMRGTPQRLDLNGALNPSSDLGGDFESCLLTTNDGALGQEIVNSRHLWLKRCGIELGAIHFEANNTESARYIADCDFHEPAGLTQHTGDYGVRFSTTLTGGQTTFIVERAVFRGSTAPSRTNGDLHWSSGFATSGIDKRPVVFRDCTFIQGRDDLPILTDSGSMGSSISFENCVFISTTGHTVPLVKSVGGASWRFLNCYFYAHNGTAIEAPRAYRLALIDCYIQTGDHFDANPISELQILNISGYAFGRDNQPLVKNLEIEIGQAAVVGTSISAVNPLVKFGFVSLSNNGPVHIDGLHVWYTNSASSKGIHTDATIFIDQGGTDDQDGWLVSNITLDLGNARFQDANNGGEGGQGVISIWGNGNDTPTIVTGVAIRRAQQNNVFLVNRSWIDLDFGVQLIGGSIGTFEFTTSPIEATRGVVALGDYCYVSKFSAVINCPEGGISPVFLLRGEAAGIEGCEVKLRNTQADTVATHQFASIDSGCAGIVKNCVFTLDYSSGSSGVVASGDFSLIEGNKIISFNPDIGGTFEPLWLLGDGVIAVNNHMRCGTGAIFVDIDGDSNIVKNNVVQGGAFVDDSGSGSIVADNQTGRPLGDWP